MDRSNIFIHISDMFNSGLKLTLNDASKKVFNFKSCKYLLYYNFNRLYF